MFKTLKQLLEAKSISEEKFAGMTAEEKAGLFNELNEGNTKAFHELKADVDATKEAIAKAQSEMIEMQGAQVKELNATMVKMGIQITKLKEGESIDTNKSFGSVLHGQLKNHLPALKRMKEEKSKEDVNMTVKVPAAMLISTNVSGGNVPVEDRVEGFNTIPSRQVRFLEVLSKRSTTSQVVSWVYQANKDGSAGGTAEGATKNQIDFDIVVGKEEVKKRTAFIKVSTEMLDDITWIESEIKAELMRELLKDVENQAYQGDGTGENLNGIRTVATAFAAGTFAGTVDNANAVDVLTVAANQIDIAEHESANYIFMHPSDVTALKMVKVSSTDKRYVERLAMVAGQLSLDGIPIIKTTLVTVGQYLIGNFDLALLVTRTDLLINIGLDGNDFTKNMRTILAEWRGLSLVKSNDRTAFVKGVFATDAAALETA